MRIGIAFKVIIFLFMIFAATTITTMWFVQNIVLENYTELRSNYLGSMAAIIDESIQSTIDIAGDPSYARSVDMLASHHNGRVIISDATGRIRYDSKRVRVDTSLIQKDEIRIDSEHTEEVFLLRTTDDLKSVYLPPKELSSHLDRVEDVSLVYFAPLHAQTDVIGQIMITEPLSRLGPSVRDVRNRFAAFMIVAFMISAAAAFVVVNRNVVRPIIKLAALSKKIAKKDFKDRVDFRSNDEISYLGRNFNTMVYNLEKMIREIEEQNEGLIHLSSELESRNEEMNRKQRLIEYDLRLAHKIQQELLPQAYPKIEGVLISAANFQVGEIGGDCFDFYKLGENRLGAFVGDVSGKGIAAALVMAMSTILFSQLKDRFDSPSEILGRVNEIMYRHFGSQHSIYLTCFFLKLDSGTMKLTYSCAGHTPPLLFRPSSGEIFNLEAEGFGLGMFSNVKYEEKTFDVAPGDKIILYTDGVTDCRNMEGQMFGFDRLVDMITENPTANTYRLTHFIVEELGDFAGQAARQDDLTLLILELEDRKS